MNLEQVNKELENLEVVDLSSAIKKDLLDYFKIWLEDEDIDIDKIGFRFADDLDGAIGDIEDKYNCFLNEYLEEGIDVFSKENLEEQIGI